MDMYYLKILKFKNSLINGCSGITTKGLMALVNLTRRKYVEEQKISSMHCIKIGVDSSTKVINF